MAEALAGLTVAASVISVLQITEDVITKCSAYRVAYKNASKDMSRLSDQVCGLRGVLLVLNDLIVAEEAQTFSRLPTLMTALDISHDDQTLGGPPEVTKSENEARLGYGLTESMPSERAGLLKRLLKNFKHKGGNDTQCESTDSIPSPTVTMGDSLTAEGGNTAGNASERKNDYKSLPRVLRDCHAELQSLSTKLETKNVRASRKEALVYAFKQGEVNKTLDRLQRVQQQIVLALSIDQIRLALEVDDNQRRQDTYQRRQDVYKWLAAPDYESKHLNAAGEWEKDTGSWFLGGESFNEWKSQPKSFLWIHGKAGAGKTILCSTIIRAMSDHSISDPSVAVAFFYFDFRSKDIEPPSLLRALIKQLSLKGAKTLTPTFNYVAKLFSDKNNGQESPSLEELKSTLKSIIGAFEKNVYIIFDALDECPDRHRFLKLIKEIHGWNFDTLRLLVTSRYEQDIEKNLRDLVSHEVSMEEGLVDIDIRVYVSRQLKDDSKLSKYSAEKKETIKTTLIDGAHGMFRWVVCQLDALRKCRSPHELKKALTKLPKTLYETYDRILLDIDEGNRDDALKLLQWLAFSVDKVSLREAVEVLATDPDGEDGPLFDPDRRFEDPRDILTLCSSLVTVTDVDETFYYQEYLKDGQIKFTELTLAHFSVREYLVSESLRTHRELSRYHCDTKLANTFIAKTCLTYLLQFNQHSISGDIRILYPLCSYAAEYWIRHTQPDNDDDPTLHWLIMRLLQPESTVYSIWLELCDPAWYSTKCAPIYYMSEAGLAIVSRDLLENGADVNAQGGKYGNALQAASSEGHHHIVQQLLEKGADVNAQGGEYGNALQAASSVGHHATIELLLEKGADVNVQGGWYGNALQAASSEGHYPIVQLLMAKGADVNLQGGEFGNALQGASFMGHHPICELLLQKGADINAQGGDCGNALQAASSGGHYATIELLLENGADVNAQGCEYGNALQAASSGGHHAIVQLLLDKGADVNAQGGWYGNALQAASSEGHHPIVQLLLGKGADVNAQGGKYGNALQAALSHGHHPIVQLLLEKGADVNAQGGQYSSALQAASSRGHHAIVQLLLEKGADVNAQGSRYGNALQAASLKGHHPIVQLLLEKGADINAQGGWYGNALQAASSEGHHAMVQLLLEKGADVNVQGGQYGNALQAASSGGRHAIVQLLLEKGADVNAQGGQYSNALQAASSEGHHAIVQLLLQMGADVNAQGGKYGNALQVASSEGHHPIVQLLLEKGAEVNAQGGKYGHALQAASSEGHHHIVQQLLEKEADVNAQGGRYGNALQAASLSRHYHIVQLLLEKGADINAQGGEYGNALQAASSEGHHAMVQLLLEKGADVNVQGGQYGSPLQAASSGGHHAIVQLLLEKGADVNVQGGQYGNALQAASSGGHHAIVQLLLGKGADANAQGGEYGNALQAASSEGHHAIVQLLLDKGADINAQGGEYGNALQAASSEGHHAIVQLLLAEGADVNAQGGEYGNALQAALSEGHHVIVQLLVSNGAGDD